MSGLNPFRPKKPEDHIAYRHQTHLSLLPKSSPTASHLVSLGPSSTAAVTADHTNRSSLTTDTPLSPINAVTLDPFSQNTSVSEDDAGRGQASSAAASRLKPDDVEDFLGDTAASSSIPSNSSSVSLEETDNENATDERRSYAGSKTSGQPVTLIMGDNSKALATRSEKKDRVPPPPPKSHHGKLISPVSSTPLSMSQTISNRATNRISFHSSSVGVSAPPRVLQDSVEYFGTPSQPAPPTDALRRSQSQHKRPPTPPLSRRHSQMRRSKSTLSKPSSLQLSTHPSTVEGIASTSSSPGSRSMTPSLRSRDSRNDSSTHDEERSNFELHSENLAPKLYLHATEVSSQGIQSSRQATSRRASSISHLLPPPPPPRRTRAGNLGRDNNLRPSLRSELNAGQAENLASHPSNAKGILADLSRLQKEVDDLRGHYENQRTH
ncbi:hypothetical protein BDW74DRAFT_149994 [Aspergillus multicolor]|uniref:uncharacterized protein n=1 Tax=Aspergillus multicolor TaxID=41759 RepID=UPI003CCD44CD